MFNNSYCSINNLTNQTNIINNSNVINNYITNNNITIDTSFHYININSSFILNNISQN
jgi:hypothetical protein